MLSGKGRRCAYDTEGNGLLKAQGSIKAGDRMWCIGAIDLDTAEEFYFGPGSGFAAHPGDDGTLEEGIRFLSECDFLIAHNGYGFDRPALQAWCPGYVPPVKEWDSLTLVKMIWPVDVLLGPDLDRIRKGKMPGQYLKRHSLAAWGHRIGLHKGDYKGGFDAWCPEMADYMMQDVRVLVALWKLCMKRLGWAAGSTVPDTFVWPESVVELEMEVDLICKQQEEHGVQFNMAKAVALSSDLQTRKAKLEVRLVEIFGSWWQPLSDIETGEAPARAMKRAMIGYPDVTIRRYGKTGKELASYIGPPFEEFHPDGPFVKIEWTKFNPSSRQHLGQRLQAVYGWKPKAYGKDGSPTVDESVLQEIPESIMPPEVRADIMAYFVVSKTLAMLNHGRQAWMRLAAEDGRLHGRLDPLGSVTGRGTHNSPNMTQVPGVKKEKVVEDGVKKEVVLRGLSGKFGWECRELMEADPDWEQTGIDMSSLELILLGHYLWKFDEGLFSARVCDPTRDPHQEHADVASILRADAKTAIYLIIYGGSAYKYSLDPALVVLPHEVPALLTYRGLPMLLKSLQKRMGEDYVEPDDMGKARIAKARQVIVALSSGITGLKDLMESVIEAAGRGWLKAFDGRKLHVRKAYAALNALLQSAGAQACKLWMVLLRRKMLAAGLKLGVDFKQVLWVHDEMQFTHRPGLGPLIRQLAEEAAVEAGELLGLRGRFRTDGKTGRSWAECH